MARGMSERAKRGRALAGRIFAAGMAAGAVAMCILLQVVSAIC